MEKIKAGEFEEKIKSAEFVLIDFSSPGCAPCQKVPPLISQVLEELKNVNIQAFEVNVVEEPEIARKLLVLGIPTIIIFKNGHEIERFISVPKIKKIIEIMKSQISG